MKETHLYGPADKPPVSQWIPLSIQHVFAMFGATILVPILTGLSIGTALFTAGTGTLIYILCTKGKVPTFLGSSFAFIPPLVSVSASLGVPYAMGGAFCAGLFYCLVALIVKYAGHEWINKALPPVVIGSVIIVIGLNLAPTAMQQATLLNNEYSMVAVCIALVTLVSVIIANIFFTGFFSLIPILIGLLIGYLFTLIMGSFFPAFHLIDFQSVKEAAWFSHPTFAAPKFNIIAILTFIIVSLATICEHMGDTMVTSNVVGKNFLEDPGLKRTLLGDGLATTWAALWGGPPNTTYGENIGVMAITKVYSVWVIGGAALFAIVLSFLGKFAALISTIPVPVMGGICTLLFGTIASAGLRTLVESGVDYKDKRNLTISSVILVIGIGGGAIKFAINPSLTFELAGVALATIVGIVLNLVLPVHKDK